MSFLHAQNEKGRFEFPLCGGGSSSRLKLAVDKSESGRNFNHSTSLEIVHLEQVLGRMPVRHPRSQSLDRRGRLEVAGHYGARLGRMRVIHR